MKGWYRPQDTKASHGIGGGEIRKAQKACEGSTARTMFCSSVEVSSPTSIMCQQFQVCNDVLQHLHPLRPPRTAKIESRPQARHWRSHKTVAEGDRSSAIVENHS